MIEFDRKNIRAWSMMGSSSTFGATMLEMPALDDSVVALTADLCALSGLGKFKEEFPDRFFNMGIAEQNMVTVAAGMAKEGLNPFVTTYATFATARSLDQVRVNMGYMGLGIKLIGLTSGFSVGILGATHMCIEDLASMRAIPGVTILSPADGAETVKAVLACANLDTPVYIRLTGGMNQPVVYKSDYEFEIGKAITLQEGKDVALIGTGTMVYECQRAAKLLKEKGIEAEVVDMHTIKPLDEKTIDGLLDRKLLVTVEEHSVIGGLGGAVAEYLSMSTNRPPHLRIGAEDMFPHAANYQHLLDESGLIGSSIASRVEQVLKEA